MHLFAFFFWLRRSAGLLCPFCTHSDWFPLLFPGHESYITFCHLENEAAFTCSADHTIRKWDVVTGQCLAIYRGHTSIVNRWALPSCSCHLPSHTSSFPCSSPLLHSWKGLCKPLSSCSVLQWLVFLATLLTQIGEKWKAHSRGMESRARNEIPEEMIQLITDAADK